MIQQGLTTSFKQQMLLAQHDLETDQLYMALYTAPATIGLDTVAYTAANETSGTGYTAGGILLVNVTVDTSGNTAFVNFDNPVWAPASFTARGALIYNASKSNKSIAVLDFGADKVTSTSFTVNMPANTATTALIRF